MSLANETDTKRKNGVFILLENEKECKVCRLQIKLIQNASIEYLFCLGLTMKKNTRLVARKLNWYKTQELSISSSSGQQWKEDKACRLKIKMMQNARIKYFFFFRSTMKKNTRPVACKLNWCKTQELSIYCAWGNNEKEYKAAN